MPDVVGLCVVPKRDDGMPCLMSFDHVCFPKAVMTCHAQRRLTVRVVQGRWFHATPDIVLPCVLLMGDDVLPCLKVHVAQGR